jgi:hypothetical protein
MLKDKHIPWLILSAFVVTFLFTFPFFFFSVDELSYVTRAMAFGSGRLDWTQITLSGEVFSWAPADYPLGTAVFLAPFAIISKYGIFLSGLVYVSISFILIHKVLKKEKINNYLPYLLFFGFLPTIYFVRGVMSEVPSLVLISIFVFILFRWKETYKKFFLLGLLTTSSIWFRETNIVLCGGLVAILLLQKPKYILAFSLASLLGSVPRFASAHYLYSTVAYVKQYAPFGLEYVAQNIPLYAIILLLLFPGGLILLFRYQGSKAGSIKLALSAFILLHLVYGYNSGDHSGFLISLFYNGRYYIPTLPLWMIIYADFANRTPIFQKKWVKSVFVAGTLIFCVGIQIFYSKLESAHREVAQDIFTKYNHAPIIYTNAAYRYLNPMNGTINQLGLLRNIQNGQTILKEKAYLFLSHRNNSLQQARQWEQQLIGLDHLKDQLNIQRIHDYSIFDGTKVVVFELSPL